MEYKHTQIGKLVLFALLAVIILFGFLFIQIGLNSILIIVMIAIIYILVSFSSLTVIIDRAYLRIKFGYGIYGKRFPLKEVVSVKAVKNHWYYGWGIRIWWWPHMIIYNVSGFDAVEIRLKNGKIYRIGTDEPRKLEHAIKQNI